MGTSDKEAHMRHTPDDLTPEQRRREIAAILAKGVLRLRQNAATAPSSPSHPESLESGQKRLAVSAPSSPDATTG